MTGRNQFSYARTCVALLLGLTLLSSLLPTGSARLPSTQDRPERQKSGKTDSGEQGPWTLLSIGNAVQGTARRARPQTELRGASEGFDRTRDSLHFLSQEAAGSFDLSVRVDAVNDRGLAGLMARVPGTSGNEPYFRITAHRMADGKAQLRTAYRSQAGGAGYEGGDKSVVVSLPVYVKITRVGSTFVSAFASDGRDYREHYRFDGKGTRLAGRALNVGVVHSSENRKVASSALVRLPRLQSTEPQQSELVSIGVKEPLVGGVASSGSILRGLPPGRASDLDDIAYLSSDNAYLKVPRIVTFPRGKTTATFDVQSQRVAKRTSATLTVVLNGQKKTVKVDLLPQETIESITVLPTDVPDKELRAVVTASLAHPAPAGGARVLISSSARGVKTPPFVTIPAGAQSAQFEVSGAGLALGNTVLTLTSAGTVRQALVDLNSVGTNFDPTQACPIPLLTPNVATDGQRVFFNSDVKEGSRVFLAGFRYNNSPPNRALPAGEGRQKIYCACRRVELESVFDLDGVPHTRPFFVVPMDAPAGEYTVVVRPKDGECPPVGGAGSDTCPESDCTSATNLFVAPSYIVSRLNRMDVNADAEDFADAPAEMSFTFGSFSGNPVASGESAVALVNFSGSYPGGVKGSGHITNPDATRLFPELPLYIGRESRMIDIDCREECAAFPAARERECLSICSALVARGRFSDHFELSFGGTEFDTSPSNWFGIAVGIGAFAVGCALAIKTGNPVKGCVASAAVGDQLAGKIRELTEEEDDILGTNSQIYNHTIGGFEWGSAVEQGPFKLTVDREKGDIDLFLQTFRVGGPLILEYKVKLKSFTVLKGYDDCSEPNEIFLHSRAFIYEGGSSLVSTSRFPSPNGVWSVNTGETENFGGVPLVIKEQAFTAENAPESPLLYVEFGVWEDDDEKDLMGLFSHTFFLADLFSEGRPLVREEITPGGLFVRRAKLERFEQVHGYVGSDVPCFGAPPPDPKHPEFGLVNLTFEIEVTWLKRTLR